MMSTKKLQQYDYFIVLDFEATCLEGQRINPQEIIELPALKVNANTYEVESTFHQFVRPVELEQLSNFCTELTTIQQDDVDKSKEFEEVFEEFCQWIEKNFKDKQFLFVTCGDWDLRWMLPNQCKLSGVEVPDYCKKWMNVLEAYEMSTGEHVRGILGMLKGLDVTHTGTMHRGIDDCTNIVNILRVLANRGSKFVPSNNCIVG